MAPTIHCKNTIYVHVLEMYPQSVICSSISLQENTRRTLDESIFRLLRASTKGRKVLTTVAFSSYMALFHLLSPLSVAALLNWTCPCCNAVLPLHWWSTGCNVHEDVILCSSQWWNFLFPCTYLVLIVYSLESTFAVFPMPSKVQPYCLSIFGHPRIIFILSSHFR